MTQESNTDALFLITSYSDLKVTLYVENFKPLAVCGHIQFISDVSIDLRFFNRCFTRFLWKVHIYMGLTCSCLSKHDKITIKPVIICNHINKILFCVLFERLFDVD